MSFLSPENVALYEYRTHLTEVVVQFCAVMLLAWAVLLSIQANRTAAQALIGARNDFEAERREYVRAFTEQRYDALDRSYMDLVLLRAQRPEFSEPESFYAPGAARNSDKIGYQSYAFALFNLLETIADKCHDEIEAANAGRRAELPALVETWAPVLASESWLHRQWFMDGASCTADRFKDKFRTLVEALIAGKQHGGPLSPGAVKALIEVAYGNARAAA